MQITHFISIVELNGISPLHNTWEVADTHYSEVIKVLVKLPMQLLLLYIPSFMLRAPENPFSLAQGESCAEEPAHPAFPAAESERVDGPIIRHNVLNPFAIKINLLPK